MRILANENISAHTIAALREAGHDVVSVRSAASGSSDDEVLRRATADDRIVLTFDKDFGELAFRYGLEPPSGVILLRIRASGPELVTRIILEALQNRDDWSGHFSVIESDRIRMTALTENAL